MRLLCLALVFGSLISCGKPLLLYKHLPHFKEQIDIKKSEHLFINQKILYDRPNWVDESYSYRLNIEIFDSTATINKAKLDVQDSSILKVNYSLSSVWLWEQEDREISGWIMIIKWTNDHIVFKENIRVIDKQRDKKLIFRGRRKITLANST